MGIDKNELLRCIDFFKELKVFETDVTSDEERDNHSKVVLVNYSFKGQIFTTNKLYYKNILHQANVKSPQNIINYFGGDVFWLDKDENDWAKGKGEAELEKTIIDEMVDGDDKDFKALLKSIANNHKTGFIQRITAEGKSGQYHHNFENNNHWHDIILLIQEIINKKGAKVSKCFFSRLVFKWDGDKNTERERSSLAKEVEWKSRTFIDNLYQNIKSIQNIIADMEIIDILTQKKQIILQGPPGTGKTYTAKDIAEQMLFSKVSEDKKEQQTLLENCKQFKLIQFHPAYSYEDFVRGIVAKSNGNAIEYVTENKILAKFAKDATENWLDSMKKKELLSKEVWFKKQLKDYLKHVQNEINDKREYILNNSLAYIREISGDKFIYYHKDYNSYGLGFGITFKELMDIFLALPFDFDYENGVIYHPGHHLALLRPLVQDLRKFIDVIPNDFNDQVQENKLSNYVLIIDEINRANLPAVLGELIYALEYRGEKVESMYATTEEGNTLILPPNLYIIGTMNTSDRSVGHIDYAIRRRFAFIDVLPKVLAGDNFEFDLFKKVSALFIQNFDEYVQDNTVELKLSEHLSEEFRPEDVWLGHSYFIKNESDFALRKKYEIVPILKEYVKDGILKQSAEYIINAL